MKPLRCLVGRHAPSPKPISNAGYRFSRCRRCGADIVQSIFTDWREPTAGFRVVWRAPESPSRPAPEPLRETFWPDHVPGPAPIREPAPQTLMPEPAPPPLPAAKLQEPASFVPAPLSVFAAPPPVMAPPAQRPAPRPASPKLPADDFMHADDEGFDWMEDAPKPRLSRPKPAATESVAGDQSRRLPWA